MADTSELDKLIVENLVDLDGAAKRIEAIGDKIFDQIIDVAESWTNDREWFGSFKREDFWVAPTEWRVDGEPEGWFVFDIGPNDSGKGVGQEAYFWLSRCLGLAGGQYCLWFDQNAGARKWKPLAKEYAQLVAEHGFHLSDTGKFYLICSLDQRTVASAIADDQLDTALAPIKEALAKAAGAVTRFSELLAKARQK